jgi:hypothetical protein
VAETDKRSELGQKVVNAYLDSNLPALRGRLYHAGGRLAVVLNEAFPEN